MQTHEKSIMIITYDMIPYTQWGSCQRMYYLADFLQDHGYSVHVVHAQKSEYLGDYGHQIRFHSIPICFPYRGVSSINNADSTSKRNGVESKYTPISILKSLAKKSKLISLERMIFNEPNLGMGTYGYLFTRRAREQIFNTISEKKIRHVIISGPPFSLFQLAPQIKRYFPKVNIILDYRDPWNTPKLSYTISSHIERNALKYADKVIFLNDRMLSDISLKYNLPREKCEVVLNGYSKQNWGKVSENIRNLGTCYRHPLSDRMIIGYIGGISFDNGGYRDLSSFFDAFKMFQENKNVLLKFVGINTSNAVERVKSQFPGTLEVLPPVDTQTSLNYMLESDVLFLNHTDKRTGRYVLTGKFFDYIQSGKVILGVASSEDTYFLEYIRKYHLGVSCLSQPQQILVNLELLYQKWMEGTLEELRTDEGLDIEILSRELQNTKYLQLLEDLES